MIFISNCKIINYDENENNNRLNKYDNRSVFLYTCLESRMILAITSELLLYVWVMLYCIGDQFYRSTKWQAEDDLQSYQTIGNCLRAR